MGLKPPITGSCLCGKVRYSCGKAPVWSVNCHCSACQKLSGAPYVSAFSVPAGCLSLTGDLARFSRVAESGNSVKTYHCAACGTRMYAQSDGAPHLTNIFAATLTDPTNFSPISNVYLSEAAPWIEAPEARYNFEKMPKA